MKCGICGKNFIYDPVNLNVAMFAHMTNKNVVNDSGTEHIYICCVDCMAEMMSYVEHKKGREYGK